MSVRTPRLRTLSVRRTVGQYERWKALEATDLFELNLRPEDQGGITYQVVAVLLS